MKITENLVDHREKAGLTQGQAADIAGVSKGQYFAWEKKGVLPNLKGAVKLAEFYGLTLDEFILGEDRGIGELTPMEQRLLQKWRKVPETRQMDLYDLFVIATGEHYGESTPEDISPEKPPSQGTVLAATKTKAGTTNADNGLDD